MKLKAFFIIGIVLFSGISMNLGHEETSSVTFLSPEEYDIVSGVCNIEADVVYRVDGNYYLDNVNFSYSNDMANWITIEKIFVELDPDRGELPQEPIALNWNTSELDDGRYFLSGVASYNYSSPLPDSEPSEDIAPPNGNGKGKYGQFLSGLSFLKYDFKYGNSGSGKPESPGEMKDSKTKPPVIIVVYVSNGGPKPSLTDLEITKSDDYTITTRVEDETFIDLVTNVTFEYNLNGTSEWYTLTTGTKSYGGDIEYFCYFDDTGKTGLVNIRAYMLNANGDAIGVKDDNLCLTAGFDNNTTITKYANITLP